MLTAPDLNACGARPGRTALLLAAGTVALMLCGPGARPASGNGGAELSCPKGSCPAGYECIDGHCQGDNHPGDSRFTGPLLMNTSCAYGSFDCNLCVDDVRARFNAILDGFDTDERVYSFKWEDPCARTSQNGCFTSNIGGGFTGGKWHFQSLMRFAQSPTDGSWLVTTRSVENGPGRFGVIRMGSYNGSVVPWRGQGFQLSQNKLVSWQPVGNLKNGFLNHASGAQMLGKLLVTGVECYENDSCQNRKAIVRIVDLSNPASPVQRASLALDQASADAAAARLADGYLVMAHTENGDNERLYFYRSNKLDTGWTRIGVWRPGRRKRFDGDFGCGLYQSYQNFQLVTQCDGKLFFVGLCRSGPLGTDTDWADLFRIDSFTHEPGHELGVPKIVKVGKKKLGMANGASFYYGGGVYVGPHHGMSLYATEATTEGDAFSVYVNEFAATHIDGQ
jgi:hypothetical protein